MINWTFPTAPPFSGESTRGYDDPHGAQAAGYYQDGGHGGHGSHGYDQHGYDQSGHYDEHGEKKKDKKDKKKDDSSRNMMIGAAAGVGVGVVGGALLANALGKLGPVVHERSCDNF